MFFETEKIKNYKGIGVEPFRRRIRALWDLYTEYITTADYTMRCGYYLCGVYPEPSWREVNQRAQSDSEHMYSVIWWAENLMTAFPEITEFSLYRDKIISVLMIHDAFEGHIGGDIPDVGLESAKNKDALEYEQAKKYFDKFPNRWYADEMLEKFAEFQKHDTDFGQIAYAFDKVDGVLRGLAYEQVGKPGEVGHHEGFIRDSDSIEFTGEISLVDCWFHNSVIQRLVDYDCGDFFIRVVEECIRYSRGKEVSWLTKVPGYEKWT